MLYATNMKEFDKRVNDWFGEVHKEVTQVAVALAKSAFTQVLHISPQYSGMFVANWRLNAAYADTSYDIDPLGTKGVTPAPFAVGSARAIGHAKAHQASGLAAFKLGQRIFISNATPMGEYVTATSKFEPSPYSLGQALESGQIRLRPINQGFDHMVERAVIWHGSRYATIDKGNVKALLRGIA